MPLEIITVPCLADNYAYLLHDPVEDTTAVVDVPDAAPLISALNARGWRADQVLITHHHSDHVQGLGDLQAAFPDLMVTGASADRHRLPPLNIAVTAGDSIAVGSQKAQVMDVSGHTIGHIAYYFADSAALFSADSLMALGCGRLFEGSPEMMWDSLSRMAALPGETLVYSGHEYAAANAKFALTIEPDNSDLRARIADIQEKRAANTPTVPSKLSLELATNPFLRAGKPNVKASVGMANATDSLVFTRIRALKDSF